MYRDRSMMPLTVFDQTILEHGHKTDQANTLKPPPFFLFYNESVRWRCLSPTALFKNLPPAVGSCEFQRTDARNRCVVYLSPNLPFSFLSFVFWVSVFVCPTVRASVCSVCPIFGFQLSFPWNCFFLLKDKTGSN